ncbi:MAG: hypothetical protein GY937_23950 [bacterium]|nr:hypothetical protein [bacterium]
MADPRGRSWLASIPDLDTLMAVSVESVSVPEPSLTFLAACGLVGLEQLKRRRSSSRGLRGEEAIA